MSVCYGALELKAGYQRNLGFGLVFSVFAFVSLFGALLILGGRLPDVVNEVKNGTILVLPAPKPEPQPKTPPVPSPQPPPVSQPKLGIFVADSFLPPEVFDQPALWPDHQTPSRDMPGTNITNNGGQNGLPVDTVIDLELDGLKPVILYKVEPEYPALARQQGITETVLAELLVDTDGLVREVIIRKKATGIFDEEVETALKHWIFKPLVIDDRVVMFRYLEAVRFTLR